MRHSRLQRRQRLRNWAGSAIVLCDEAVTWGSAEAGAADDEDAPAQMSAPAATAARIDMRILVS